MVSIQEQYFNSIYRDFSTKIRVLASLIQANPGEQGRLVERVVLDLLAEFLPTRYSYGSGFVIDSKGNQSRQCDIVIYDTTLTAGLFHRTGPVLFPVEAVYGVIEIKTTLDKHEVNDACDHIASVKRLVNVAKPTLEPALDEDGRPAVLETRPSPPIGVVIGFKSATRVLGTIRGWFDDAFSGTEDTLLHPDLCVAVQEAVAVEYVARSHKPA